MKRRDFYHNILFVNKEIFFITISLSNASQRTKKLRKKEIYSYISMI